MREVILVRYGEIILKGLNRPVFEAQLVKNIRKVIHTLGKARITRSQGRVYVEPAVPDYDIDSAIEKIRKVLGVISLSRVFKIASDMDEIRRTALRVAQAEYSSGKKTFRIETKRGNKAFGLNSLEVSADVGGYVIKNIPDLKVNLTKPEFTVHIEVRESSYVYSAIIPAYGGMPVGTNGKAVLLLSGGIDSPVAGWMIAKRGVELEAVHFSSPPYTGDRAKEKVIELCRIVSEYCGRVRLHIVRFTDIQLAIYENCPDEQITIIMRRVMMRIAERIAEKAGAGALVTGESLGQVASQTMEALAVTDEVVNMPILRPLIGMDKSEIVETAQKIGTFETSILPYEDCCTIFVPKHPELKPKKEKIAQSEKHVNLTELIEKALTDIEVIDVGS